MRRIEVRARHKTFRDLLRCRVRAFVLQQLRQNVSVRTFGAAAIGGRDRLKYLNPPDAADKYTMRGCRHDDAHHRIACLEDISSSMLSKISDDHPIRDANARINVRNAKTKIEQGRFAITATQRFSIGPQFC